MTLPPRPRFFVIFPVPILRFGGHRMKRLALCLGRNEAAEDCNILRWWRTSRAGQHPEFVASLVPSRALQLALTHHRHQEKADPKPDRGKSRDVLELL
jgi:hypothetical protein